MVSHTSSNELVTHRVCLDDAVPGSSSGDQEERLCSCQSPHASTERTGEHASGPGWLAAEDDHDTHGSSS
jgi:hypothetical protein